MAVNVQLHAPAALPAGIKLPVRNKYIACWSLGPVLVSWEKKEFLASVENLIMIALLSSSVRNYYTDCTIPPPRKIQKCHIFEILPFFSHFLYFTWTKKAMVFCECINLLSYLSSGLHLSTWSHAISTLNNFLPSSNTNVMVVWNSSLGVQLTLHSIRSGNFKWQ